MSTYPVGDSSVAAALAAMPLEIRATRAADYVFLMRRAERMDKVNIDLAAKIRAQATALLTLPPARTCDHCGGAVGMGVVEFYDAELDVHWLTCEDCEREVELITADHRG